MLGSVRNIEIIQLGSRKLTIECTENKKETTLPNGRSCFFPIGPWKTPRYTPIGKDPDDLIYTFSLKEKFFDQIQSAISTKIKDVDEPFTQQLFNEISPHLNLAEGYGFRAAEIRVFPPRQRSTAYNFSTGDYLGLHIDSHDSIANRNRFDSWFLIGLNTGVAERYLYFVDLSFARIINLLSIENDQDLVANRLPMHKIVAAFFQNFPNYPIMRLKMLPGDGYILRPQNLIHDGGTNWKGVDDISYLASVTSAKISLKK